jgi:hypothetical protein
LSDKQNIAEMCGETLREAGTLVIVFAPLYQLFEPTKQRWKTFLAIVIAGVFFLGLGIEVERRRA